MITLFRIALIIVISYSYSAHSAGLTISTFGTPETSAGGGFQNVNNFSASTGITNPAGIAGQESSAQIGFQYLIINNDASYNYEGRFAINASDDIDLGSKSLIPSFSLIRKQNEHISYGVSLFVPMASSVDYGRWPGQQIVDSSSINIVNLMGSIAAKLSNRLSLGFSVGVQTMNYTLKAEPFRTETALSREIDFEGSGIAPSFRLGLQYELAKETLLGISYYAPTGYTGISLGNGTELSLQTPQSLSIGVSQTFLSQHTVAVNLGYENWQAFGKTLLTNDSDSIINSIVLDKKMVDTYDLNLSYRYAGNKTDLYGSVGYSSSPFEDKYRTPDLPLDESYKFGLGLQLNQGTLKGLGISYGLQFNGNAEYSQSLTDQGPTISGKSEDYNINSISLSYTF